MPLSTTSSTPTATRSLLRHLPVRRTVTSTTTRLISCFPNLMCMSPLLILLKYQTRVDFLTWTRHPPSDPNRRLHPRHQPNGNVDGKKRHHVLPVQLLHGPLMTRRNSVSSKKTNALAILGKSLHPSWVGRHLMSNKCGKASRTILSEHLRSSLRDHASD